jgi:hypothetical protein
LTHTHQARAPTDQRAPITPIGLVAYLANLGRAADQIGGYLRVRWRAWWLRCDDHGRGRLGRTARASALAWLERPPASAADLTRRAGRLRCHSRSALRGDIVPRQNRQAPRCHQRDHQHNDDYRPKVGCAIGQARPGRSGAR